MNTENENQFNLLNSEDDALGLLQSLIRQMKTGIISKEMLRAYMQLSREQKVAIIDRKNPFHNYTHIPDQEKVIEKIRKLSSKQKRGKVIVVLNSIVGGFLSGSEYGKFLERIHRENPEIICWIRDELDLLTNLINNRRAKKYRLIRKKVMTGSSITYYYELNVSDLKYVLN